MQIKPQLLTVFSHYGETLAHPLGANFKEFIFKGNCATKEFCFFDASIMYATVGKDDNNSHWGRNIYKSDYASNLGYSLLIIKQLKVLKPISSIPI